MKDGAPMGWETRPLGDVAELVNGRAYKKSELLDSGPYRVLRVGNFFTNQHWYYSDLELPEKNYCESGDLLYAWSASFGPRIWSGEKCIFHYHIWKVDFDETRVLRDFLFYYFEWDKDLIRKEQGAGATMIHVSKRSMEQRALPLPPVEQQRRIVGVLDEAFESLSLARANVEANLREAQVLFSNALLTLFSEIDATAPRKALSEVAKDFGRGRSRHRPRNAPFLYGGPYPFIQTGDVRQADGVLMDFSQSYSEEGLAQSKLWPAGTVCITIAANIAETAILGMDACFPDSVIGMVPDTEVTSSEYVEYMLRFFAAELKAQGKGSAQDNINLGTFERATFPFPDVTIQAQLVETLDAVGRETTALRDHYSIALRDCEELRQSLLQKAFAGELT